MQVLGWSWLKCSAHAMPLLRFGQCVVSHKSLDKVADRQLWLYRRSEGVEVWRLSTALSPDLHPSDCKRESGRSLVRRWMIDDATAVHRPSSIINQLPTEETGACSRQLLIDPLHQALLPNLIALIDHPARR